MMKIAEIRLREAGKILFFETGDLEVKAGNCVIIEGDKGLEYGHVMSEPVEVDEKEIDEALKKIVRIANVGDVSRIKENKKETEKVFEACVKKIGAHKLDMKLVEAEYSFDRSKLVFYFTSAGRVDFRALVKDLAKVFRARIELRQIGVRDEAKLLGGFGPCGRTLCCAKFLKDFEPVTIRMAKEQNLPLNPTKISGLCGRLMCCLAYEHDLYRRLLKGLPRTGEMVDSPKGSGKVISVNPLKRSVTVEMEDKKTVEVSYPEKGEPDKKSDVKTEKKTADNHLRSKNKFYLTTPLYYVNGRPHIGHSYTNVAADTLARFHRLKGEETFLLTGTDEHGQKVEQAAVEEKLDPQTFVDGIVHHFSDLWGKLSVEYDDFIRTTEERHCRTVQEVLKILYEKGDIYEAEYSGWYCVPCETFLSGLPASDTGEIKCPDCGRNTEKIHERNYFFRMSKYRDWLIKYIKHHPDFIKPASRENEVLGFLENPLTDLCISRPRDRLKWGIPLPFSEDHVTYVWIDALINYISAAGFITDKKKFEQLWPADVHLVGKDILRFHAVYWPIILRALGLEPPRQIFAHGWWKVEGGKMSKSKGNIVDPLEVMKKYGVDAYRYYLLREVPFGLDGSFSEDAFVLRLNSDLANDLGNLVYRTLTMVEKYYRGEIPEDPAGEKDVALDSELKAKANGLPDELNRSMKKMNFCEALSAVWELVNLANKYIERSAPWNVFRENRAERLKKIIYNLCEVIRIVGTAVSPFLPGTAADIAGQLGIGDTIKNARLDDLRNWGMLKAGTRISKGKPLFPRIEDKKK